jgi:hypothetical protein
MPQHTPPAAMSPTSTAPAAMEEGLHPDDAPMTPVVHLVRLVQLQQEA